MAYSARNNNDDFTALMTRIKHEYLDHVLQMWHVSILDPRFLRE